MNLSPILELIRERTGMDPSTLGEHSVRAAIQGRLRALGMDDVGRYAERVVEDAGEWAALVDEVAVPETWFFRGGEVFGYLAEHIRSVASSRPGQPVRVLSLPCSTGEEPYSLAIALLERGAPSSSYSILGVDLSSRLVEQARRGVYREMSFRQLPGELRERYFQRTGGAWELRAEVREMVRFQVGNFFDEGLLRSEPVFDLVFCRNLFIYLARQMREKALTVLLRLLHPEGVLCLGHADALGREDGRFERFGPADYFAYRRGKGGVKVGRRGAEFVVPPSGGAGLVVPPSGGVCHPAPPEGGTTNAAPPEGGTTNSLDPLALAREQANQGQYAEALALCGEIEKRQGPSGDLYSLVGVIHQARQDFAAAAQAFNRALYLDPAHREALVHLMLLHQLQGDSRRAAVLRGRLDRLPRDAGEVP